MSPRQFLLLLASIRFANLPSVVSNVWLGVALGMWGGGSGLQHLWLTTGLLTLAGLALYISGNFFNDWHDRDWDARHRPERALPQGAFAPGLYLTLGITFAVMGVALACFVGLPSGVVAGLIVLCILGYTRWHKTGAWTVILMGLCRALLPMLFLSQSPLIAARAAGSTQFGLVIFTIPLALLLYIAALSQLARHEATTPEATRNSLPALALLLIATTSMNMLPGQLGSQTAAVLGLLPYLGWLMLSFSRFRRPVSRQISALLAGLPLLDWVVLLPLACFMRDHPALHPVALVSLLLPPLAFIAGRLLQRVAPAT